MKRVVIILQGRMAEGKTTIASLIAASGGWQVVDLNPRYLARTPGVRELAMQPKLIVCCEDVHAKKFHHWWSVVLADAQVFYWNIERRSIELQKPSTITFKNKHQ